MHLRDVKCIYIRKLSSSCTIHFQRLAAILTVPSSLSNVDPGFDKANWNANISRNYTLRSIDFIALPHAPCLSKAHFSYSAFFPNISKEPFQAISTFFLAIHSPEPIFSFLFSLFTWYFTVPALPPDLKIDKSVIFDLLLSTTQCNSQLFSSIIVILHYADCSRLSQNKFLTCFETIAKFINTCFWFWHVSLAIEFFRPINHSNVYRSVNMWSKKRSWKFSILLCSASVCLIFWI